MGVRVRMAWSENTCEVSSVAVAISIVTDNVGPAQQQRTLAAAFENLYTAIAHQLVPEPVALALVRVCHIVCHNVRAHAAQQPSPVARSSAKLHQRAECEQSLQRGVVGDGPREVAADAGAPVEALLDCGNAAFGRQWRVRSQMTMKSQQRISIP